MKEWYIQVLLEAFWISAQTFAAWIILIIYQPRNNDHAAPEPNRVGVPNASLTHWCRVLSRFWTCHRPLISRTKRIRWPQNLHFREAIWNPPDLAESGRMGCPWCANRPYLTHIMIAAVAIKASEHQSPWCAPFWSRRVISRRNISSYFHCFDKRFVELEIQNAISIVVLTPSPGARMN